MAVSTNVTFWEMFRELPVQTGVYSVGPLLIAFAQLINGYYHQVPPVYLALFGTVMAVFAGLVTQYHLTEFRLQKVQQQSFERDAE